MKTFKIVGNDMSDGYHTFDELYDHRCLLFVLLCLSHRKQCYWLPHYENWFLLVLETEHGQISYHIPEKYLPLIDGKIIRNLAHAWDGHTSADVIDRLILSAKSSEGE